MRWWKEKKAKELTEHLFIEAIKRGVAPSDLCTYVLDVMEYKVPKYARRTYSEVCISICFAENFVEEPEPIPEVCDSMEGVRYRDMLKKFGSEEWTRHAHALAEMFDEVFQHCPLGNGIHIPLTQLVDVNAVVNNVVYALVQKKNLKLFPVISHTLGDNYPEKGSRVIYPKDYTDDNAPWQYLKNTPLLPLFDITVPFSIPENVYFEHQMVLGKSGSGKSTMLKHQIMTHIRNPAKPSLVVMDSEGELIPLLRSLDEIKDRVVYISPRNPPAINLFDDNTASTESFFYLFGTILRMDLTGHQETFFKYLADLMMEIDNATMHDMIKVCDDVTPYKDDIDRLSIYHQEFFNTDYKKDFKIQRKGVRARIFGLLINKTFRKMLNTPETTFNLGDEIDKGSIVLIDTDTSVLGDSRDAYGKFFIFHLMQCLNRRIPLPAHKRYPTFFVCDEAHYYFSHSVSQMLIMLRKLRCGCCFAFQKLQGIGDDVLASLLNSTSVKMVGRTTADDATKMAKNMGRTTTEFIAEIPHHSFATFIDHKDMPRQAVTIKPTYNIMEDAPRCKPAKAKTYIKKESPIVKPIDLPIEEAVPQKEKSTPVETVEKQVDIVEKLSPDIDTSASNKW